MKLRRLRATSTALAILMLTQSVGFAKPSVSEMVNKKYASMSSSKTKKNSGRLKKNIIGFGIGLAIVIGLCAYKFDDISRVIKWFMGDDKNMEEDAPKNPRANDLPLSQGGSGNGGNTYSEKNVDDVVIADDVDNPIFIEALDRDSDVVLEEVSEGSTAEAKDKEEVNEDHEAVVEPPKQEDSDKVVVASEKVDDKPVEVEKRKEFTLETKDGNSYINGKRIPMISMIDCNGDYRNYVSLDDKLKEQIELFCKKEDWKFHELSKPRTVESIENLLKYIACVKNSTHTSGKISENYSYCVETVKRIAKIVKCMPGQLDDVIEFVRLMREANFQDAIITRDYKDWTTFKSYILNRIKITHTENGIELSL